MKQPNESLLARLEICPRMTRIYKKKTGRIRMKENCKEDYFPISLVELQIRSPSIFTRTCQEKDYQELRLVL